MQKLHPGMMIDGFEVLERLHRGGMATLWHVKPSHLSTQMRPDLPDDLIMKVPYLSDQSDPTAIVSFEVEQMIMPGLQGPHVPRFVASGAFDKQPYIVMERVAGESLRSRLDHAPLPLDEVIHLGGQIAHALHALHSQQVIHLDIKPSNIVLRADGTAVLVDFGLARHDHLPDLLAEEFRLPLGTGPYIAPEQVLRVRNDPRSDLFALGVLLYHLLTGQRPFGFPTTLRGLRQRLWRDPIPPRAHRPDCPPWLQEVILRCLAVNPLERYSTAAQLAFDLQHPEQVSLSARADKQTRDGFWTVWQRRWHNRWQRILQDLESERQQASSASTQLQQAPIMLVAVDLSSEWQALAEALRVNAQRIFNSAPHARLACVTVLKTQRIGLDVPIDKDGHNWHIKKLVQLKDWARALQVPAGQMTFHVLEAPDPASAIIDYAHTNHVDQIILGARGGSNLRRYLGSVSAKVVAEAACTVTVVKLETTNTDQSGAE